MQRSDPESHAVAVQGVSCTLELKLYLFPFWHFAIDGRPVSATAGYIGTTTLQVPAGQHQVTAVFRRQLAPVLAGWAITLITTALLFLLGWRSGRTGFVPRSA